MKYIYLLILLSSLNLLATGCLKQPEKSSPDETEISIAFLPDIHFHDIYGQFSDETFDGLPTDTVQGTQYASIRSMRAQLHSTRLFNENYFALLAALDDIAQRNIKLVALPGDFSDDGQPLHMRGLKSILDKYSRQHGMEFFAAPGNHDPTRPFSHPAGKPDYLGAGGKEQPIFSRQHQLCQGEKQHSDMQSHAVFCSDDVQELGYKAIMDLLGEHGFYPKSDYRYFETPYSSYSVTNYDFLTASREANFDNRHYEICHQGTGGKYKRPHYSDCHQIADSSYLVEPIEGLWLLAIDANVYQPKKNSSNEKQDAEDFLGSSDAGYNKVITHKTHLLEWIADVVQRAQVENKTLIAFSHFPMQEFYDGAGNDIAQLMGEQKFQLSRKPTTDTSKTLADTGLKIHVAGHMHINDTGIFHGDDGKVLFNIQAPSLAAYIPAYKILTIKTDQDVEVETVVLKDVPRFDELFAHYRDEWNYLQTIDAPDIWNIDMLQAKNYYQFTEWHLRELARLRFLPQEWPADIRELLMELNGAQLLTISQLKTDISLEQIAALIAKQSSEPKTQHAWELAVKQASIVANSHGLILDNFAAWTGKDLSVDFYRLWSADQLALRDIDPQRFAHYELLAQQFLSSGSDQTHSHIPNEGPRHPYQERIGTLLKILVQFSGDAPSDHFLLQLNSGTIKTLSRTQDDL